jgi:ComF family protein
MINDFVSLFFPRFCLGCNGSLLKGESHVCIHCYSKITKTNSHHENDNFIMKKFYGKVKISSALAYYVFFKKGIVQHLLHSLKYDNQPTLAIELGARYAVELLKNNESLSFEVLVPVPLHQSKLKIRGYNQSEQFALGLSQILDIPVKANALKRIKATTTQTSKTRLERWKNVDQIFEITDDGIVGKHVLIVDDVITTGATLESCALCLLEHGAKDVSVIAIAAAK